MERKKKHLANATGSFLKKLFTKKMAAYYKLINKTKSFMAFCFLYDILNDDETFKRDMRLHWPNSEEFFNIQPCTTISEMDRAENLKYAQETRKELVEELEFFLNRHNNLISCVQNTENRNTEIERGNIMLIEQIDTLSQIQKVMISTFIDSSGSSSGSSSPPPPDSTMLNQ